MILIQNYSFRNVSLYNLPDKILQSYVNQDTLEQYRLEIDYNSQFHTDDVSNVPDASVYFYESLDDIYYYPLYLTSYQSNFALIDRATGLKFVLENTVGLQVDNFLRYLSSFNIPVSLSYQINRVEYDSYSNYVSIRTYIYDSNLYTEIIDNSNQFQLLNSLNQVSGSHLSEEDFRDIIAIESYNRNYLLAHLQTNVTGNLEISGNINATTSGSGGGSSTVDLSGVVTQLQNINEKLNYEDSTGNNADIAEMLFWIAQALQGGLVYADDQQNLQSYLHYIGKKLEYTQTIDEEPVTKNITETLSDVLKSLDDIVDRPIITTNEDLSPWSAV